MQPANKAALAKHFKIVTVNIAPIDSQEMRHLFAITAREEEKTREIGFYSDLMDKSKLQQGCPIPSMHIGHQTIHTWMLIIVILEQICMVTVIQTHVTHMICG